MEMSIPMDTQRWRRIGVVALGLLGAGSASPVPRACLGQAAREGAVPVPLSQALRTTTQTGKATVVVVTSRSEPGSLRLWWALLKAPEAQTLGALVQFAEMPQEQYPNEVRGLGVSRFPTVLVYRRGARGLELAGHQGGPMDAEFLSGWLDTLGLEVAGSPKADTSLLRANHESASPQIQPSPQTPLPALPPAAAPPPPPVLVAQPVAPPPPNVTPVYTTATPAPLVFSTPSTPIMIQPSAPTVILGSTPPPNIVVANAPPSPPNVVIANTQPAAPNLYLGAQPAPVAPPPTSYYVAAPPAAAPLAPQAAPAPVAIVLEGPGLFDRILADIGRLLVRHGNPRLRMTEMPATIQAPMLAMPAAGAPQNLYALPAQGYAPQSPPPTYLQMPQAPPPQSPPTMPSPQSEAPRKHLFNW